MQFLFNPIGSFGDLHPYLAIGSLLKQRGHDVTVIANSYYEHLIRRTGLGFVAWGTAEDQEDFWRNPKKWNPWNGWKVSLDWCVIRPMRQTYKEIAARYIPGETVIAGPGWAFGARIAQDKLGVPMATLHLSANWLQSVHQSPKMPPPMWLPDRMPQAFKRLQYWVADTLFTDRFLGPPTNAFRAELSLPPVRRLVGRWWHSPQRVIGMFPDWFGLPQPDWPKQTVLTGFPLWDRGHLESVPEGLAEFLAAGDPPLVFTSATTNQHLRQYFDASVEACRRLGRRGILITNYTQNLPDVLPDGVRHYSYVPFGYLLPRAAVLVSNATAGTMAQGLAAGIPQLVTPMTFDQPQNAASLVRLGVGISVNNRAFRGKHVADLLQRILASPVMAERCRNLARRFAGVNPVEQTCQLLEQLVETDASCHQTSRRLFVDQFTASLR